MASFRSAKVLGKTVGLVALASAAIVVGEAAGEGSLMPPTYSEVRTEVTVTQGPRVTREAPRPANFYQLAGAANQELCADTLQAFNEPGKYHGGDGTRWLLDNSRQVDFRRLVSPGPTDHATENDLYVFPGLEYASADIDADGKAEHIYRLNNVIHSLWHQQLMIVPDRLQDRPELLTSHARRCTEMNPAGGCDSINVMIVHALMAGVPERLANEWKFSREGIWNWTTRDAESQRLIYKSRNQALRNVGSDSGAYWSLFRIGRGVVAVGASIMEFAPPELLVFVPNKDTVGTLQCVIMPVAWHPMPPRDENEAP